MTYSNEELAAFVEECRQISITLKGPSTLDLAMCVELLQILSEHTSTYFKLRTAAIFKQKITVQDERELKSDLDTALHEAKLREDVMSLKDVKSRENGAMEFVKAHDPRYSKHQGALVSLENAKTAIAVLHAVGSYINAARTDLHGLIAIRKQEAAGSIPTPEEY